MDICEVDDQDLLEIIVQLETQPSTAENDEITLIRDEQTVLASPQVRMNEQIHNTLKQTLLQHILHKY